MKDLLSAGLCAAVLIATPLHAASVINGDFETGDFTGYDVLASEGIIFNPPFVDPAPFASVETVNGNSFAELRTQPRGPFRFVSVSQSIALSLASPIIGFDLSEFLFVDDNSPNPGTSRQDTFYFALKATFDPLIEYTGTNVFGTDPTAGGLMASNFAVNNGIGVSFAAPIDNRFATRVLIDFSNYAPALDPAQPLAYEFAFFSQNDGKASTVSFDNLRVQSLAGAVPEPTTWAMMLFGFFAIGGVLRSRRKERRSQAARA